MTRQLPDFIAPMLAKAGQPFDSDDYFFEVKWDGIRCLAFVDDAGYRLINRRRAVMTPRYPEFAFLSRVPPGTILDGEVVVLKQGKADFPLLMSREGARSSPAKILNLSKTLPATFIAFDVLYSDYHSVMPAPLEQRRELLREIVRLVNEPQLVFPEGIVGQGKAYFQEVCNLNLEGVIAKRLKSPYMPGQRNEAWIKVKRGEVVLCLVLGFEPDGDDFRNLIIAAEKDGQLHHVGQVGSGFDNPTRKRLNGILKSRLRDKPIIPCKIKGKWIEPGLYCRVHCMERTATGHLRAPAFKGLVEDADEYVEEEG